MKIGAILSAVVAACLLAASATAGTIPRTAQTMKESGNDFLAAKKYADAIDSYIQALQIFPDFAEAHYNLGVALLNGYKAAAQARHHFEKYLELTPNAADREEVQKLVTSLAARVKPAGSDYRTVVAVVGGRLLVSGGDWVKPGDSIEISEPGKDPCACLIAEYVYPDSVLTQRVWDDKKLVMVKIGLLAVNTTE